MLIKNANPPTIVYITPINKSKVPTTPIVAKMTDFLPLNWVTG